MNNDILISPEQVALDQQKFIAKVYTWMAGALAITGFVALYVASTPGTLSLIINNRGLFFGLIIAELLLVGSLVGFVNRLSATTATLIFVGYAVLNGLTLSILFLIYTAGSIAATFFITAGMFAAMSAYGYFTQKDLTKMGSILIMALVGVIIASLVNMFFYSQTLYWVISYAGVLIFTGLIAWDTQKLKAIGAMGIEDPELYKKRTIIGALTLYLDFINLFLMLLRFFGRRR